MRITKYVLGLDGANRFDSFYSVGAPAQGFVRYSAVDNRDNHLTASEFDAEAFHQRWHRDPRPAEKGCMLSHVKMWKEFVASDADWALIAEDDVLLSPDAQAVVEAIITKHPQVQLVNLCDSFANDAGKLNPHVEYIRLSLLSPFVYGKYRMGKPYGSWPLVCTGLYLISRSGAELLLKQFESKGPGLFDGLRSIGVDETSYRKGHTYMTVVVDPSAYRSHALPVDAHQSRHRASGRVHAQPGDLLLRCCQR